MDRESLESQRCAAHLWEEGGQEARNWLMSRGLWMSTLRAYSLGARSDGDVNIPYLNPDGSVRLNRIRFLNPTRMKYKTPAGYGQHIYNVADTAKPHVYITEGEFDCLILKQLGLDAVGIPGTNAFRQDWRYLFTYTEQVTIMADGDQAGEKAANRLASMIGSMVDVRVVHLPPDFDVNDLWLQDKDMLKELIS